jgi:hypothetical protein
VWLIGRAYAAAIERRRAAHVGSSADDFYLEQVAPKFRTCGIDSWFGPLRQSRRLTRGNLEQVVGIHFRLTHVLRKISGLDKRSLASKYLHFHFPDHFFIYDSRAVQALRQWSHVLIRAERYNGEIENDNEYRKFCDKCVQLTTYVKREYDKNLTPRQLDNLLLDKAPA